MSTLQKTITITSKASDVPNTAQQAPPWVVLVIDDEQSVLDVTDNILKRFRFKDRGLQLEYATSFSEARTLYQDYPHAAVAIVDCTMEKDTSGLDFVDYVRKQEGNTTIQLVLRTGQPGFAPEQQVLIDYEINDYLAKTELTSTKLKHRMISYLRAYENVLSIEKKNEELKKLDKIKDNFLSVVSHELRCPLNAAKGLINLLKEEHSDDSQLLEDLGLIESCNQRMDGLVSDLINSASIRRNEFSMSFAEHSLYELVEEIMPNIRMLAKYLDREDSVTIHQKITHTLPLVTLDKQRIQQVMINLLNNALKFTESGSITISAEQTDQHLVIAISDTGIGVNTKDSQSIFSEFCQTKEAKAFSPDGLGLGLSIAKKIVEAHQGRIHMHNKHEGGCTFSFSLAY